MLHLCAGSVCFRVYRRLVGKQEKEVFGEIKIPTSASMDLISPRVGRGQCWVPGDFPGLTWFSGCRLPPSPPKDAAVSSSMFTAQEAHLPPRFAVSPGHLSLQ